MSVITSMVFLINYSHGAPAALVAAAKQAAYTFFVAGFIMQFCRSLAARGQSDSVAVANATAVPTLITVVLVFALHSVRGTPEPVLSTLPVAVLGLVAFYVTARAIRLEL